MCPLLVYPEVTVVYVLYIGRAHDKVPRQVRDAHVLCQGAGKSVQHVVCEPRVIHHVVVEKADQRVPRLVPEALLDHPPQRLPALWVAGEQGACKVAGRNRHRRRVFVARNVGVPVLSEPQVDGRLVLGLHLDTLLHEPVLDAPKDVRVRQPVHQSLVAFGAPLYVIK